MRAGLVGDPAAYYWSSAAAHCEGATQDPLVDLAPWRAAWTSEGWSQYLREAGIEEQAEAIRRNTHSGRPLGTPGFVADLEERLRRRLAPDRGGRPLKQSEDRQGAFCLRRF